MRSVTLLKNTVKITDSLLSIVGCGFKFQKRTFAAPPKRFYKNTGIVQGENGYEVILDHRKLKTPNGNVLKIQNELLAVAVATEWDSQKSIIDRSSMHLTALCCTAQDNPNKVNKEETVQQIVSFLDTDTVLFFSQNDILESLQKKEWSPLIDWFCERFEVDVQPTKDIMNSSISENTKSTMEKYLMSYSFPAIIGFSFSVESLKSFILTLCCVERKLSVDQAVLLSRLEEEYQTTYWGRVEWSHDMNQYDLQSRVAAGILFIHLNSMSEQTESTLSSALRI